MLAVFASWLEAFTSLLSLQNDRQGEIAKKKVMGIACILIILICGVCLAMTELEGVAYLVAGMCLGIVGSGCTLCFLVVKKTLPRILTHIFGYTLTVGVILIDFDSAQAGSERKWPLIMLVINLMIACNASTDSVKGVAYGTGVWLLLQAAEASFRFGLYDIGGTSSYSNRAEITDCSEPPCGIGVAAGLRGALLSMSIVLLNQMFVRELEHIGRSKACTLKTATDVLNEFLESITTYDLDSAEKTVESSTNVIDSEIAVSIHNLLKCLAFYRPHIPDTLFDQATAPSTKWEPSSMGKNMPTSRAAIVYTAVHEPTALWARCGSAMRIAVQTHANVVRLAIEEFNGYEVSSIGESFMIAFASATDACNFGLSVQERLLEQDWPLAVGKVMPKIKPDDAWNGLNLRIGIHYGDVQQWVNPASMRTEYNGDVVTKAARIEEICLPGTIAVSEEVISVLRRRKTGEDCDGQDFLTLDNPIVVSMGSLDLPEFPESYISLMLPQSLHGRRACVRELMAFNTDPDHQQPKEQVSDDDGVQPLQNESDCEVTTGIVKIPMSSKSLAYTPKFLKRELENSVAATVQKITLLLGGCKDAVTEKVNEELEKAIRCVERCEGAVVTIVSNSMIASWNTGRRCHSHFNKSIRCVSLLHDEFGSSSKSVQGHVGIASGEVKYGIVGSHFQKFSTVLGETVNLAGMLADSAADICTFALCAPPGPPYLDGALERLLRPVDDWSSASFPSSITIYEVNASLLKGTGIVSLHAPPPPTSPLESSGAAPWGWSVDYCTAYAQKDFASIVSNAGSDPVAQKVASFLQYNTHLRLPVQL
eukprot:TRINITY_DN17180_c0_g1_i1.p1 TRINITY_DN17180_c0_g1~~TRINITY_DN17180_c0_g1_i1.p1  ORF type:complete len:836 (+),score=103.11 TRINITY_DN17180_c0_g1_i1:46-2508(+)